MNITLEYSHTIDDEQLDAFLEQEIWDAAEVASHRFRLALVQFWSKATPKRRAEAAKNKEKLGLQA